MQVIQKEKLKVNKEDKTGREPEIGLVDKAGPVSSSPSKRVMHQSVDVPRLTGLSLLNPQHATVTFPDPITVEDTANIWTALLALLM